MNMNQNIRYVLCCVVSYLMTLFKWRGWLVDEVVFVL